MPVPNELETRLLAVLDSIPEGVEICDATGRILYVNPAFTRITGVPASARVGRMIQEVAPDGVLFTVMESRAPILGLRSRPRGSVTDVIVNAVPIIQDGELMGAAAVFQDVGSVADYVRHLDGEARTPRAHVAAYTFEDFVGTSPAARKVVDLARAAARTESTVLITGESGTGKELLAQAIHNMSRRRAGPFVKVNCAAIPETLLESEFFGHEKGAFTGASERKPGLFELANRGTIFLDEVGDLQLSLQAKLLRVVQDQEFHRVGGTSFVRVDVRIIAATNQNLPEAVQQGRFRADLYYRLNVVNIHVPPLRERRADIPDLVRAILARLGRRLGHKVEEVAPEAMEMLTRYDWPGNVRELENILERAVVMMDPGARRLGPEELRAIPELSAPPSSSSLPLDSGEIYPLDHLERQMIMRAIEHYGTSWEGKRRAAKALNISLATLYNKLKKHNMTTV